MIFIIIYFILLFILTFALIFVDNKKTYKEIKNAHRGQLWFFTVISLLIMINKSAYWILCLIASLWILTYVACMTAEINIKYKEKQQEELRQRAERLKQIRIKKEEYLYIEGKKQELKIKIMSTINSFIYVSPTYKSFKLDQCFYIIDNVKTRSDLLIVLNDCQKIIDELYGLNKAAKERHNSQNTNNTNANNKKKSNSTSYTYTVNGALSLLNLTANSTTDEIKSAYRKLAKTHHPDRGGDKDNFLKLNAAYETLRNHYNF